MQELFFSAGCSACVQLKLYKAKPFLNGLSRVRAVEIIKSKTVSAVFQTMMVADVSQFLKRQNYLARLLIHLT